MAQIDIATPPAAPDFVRFRSGIGPRFIVTIDTEEEFDWDSPIARESSGVSAVPAIRRFQDFCEKSGVVPLYVVDQPIAECPASTEALGDAIAAGRAEIGIHLHPWLSAPFDEVVCEFNSFAGNLPASLESAKFTNLQSAITARMATRPLAYRAGRYGIGPASAAILKDGGISVDTSVRPLFNYRAGGGPDFTHHPLRPYWIDRQAGLMELPLTAVYWGSLRRAGRLLHGPINRIPRLSGAVARTGLLQRIPLTPEGVTAEEAIRAIDTALGDGLPLLVFSFHSPSLAPGHTPYVRSAADLETFYSWWERIFDHLAQRGVAPSNIKDILASVALA